MHQGCPRFDWDFFLDIIQRMLNQMTEMREATIGEVPLDQEALIAMLKALSDPTRLSIFDMLMDGVQCNCEIAERLGLSLNLISHHLRVLREAGLVQSERASEDARWIYYTVDQEALGCLRTALERLLDVGRIQPRRPSCGPGGCKTC